MSSAKDNKLDYLMLSPRKPFVERAERYEFNSDIKIATFGTDIQYTVYCQNISASGFLIESPPHVLPFHMGTLVEIVVHSLDIKRPVKVTGKIVRIFDKKNSQGEIILFYGIQLIFLNHQELKVWFDMIETVKELVVKP